jgi:hypothetical protein
MNEIKNFHQKLEKHINDLIERLNKLNSRTDDKDIKNNIRNLRKKIVEFQKSYKEIESESNDIWSIFGTMIEKTIKEFENRYEEN